MTVVKLAFSLLIAFCAGTRAFVILPAHRSSKVVLHSKTTMMSPIDLMCVENAAEYCLREECDVEDIAAQINQLQDQRDFLLGSIHQLDLRIGKLKGSTIHDKKPQEIESLIQSIDDALSTAEEASSSFEANKL